MFVFSKSQVQIVKKSGKHEIEIRIVNRHERSQKTAKKDYQWKTETKKWFQILLPVGA